MTSGFSSASTLAGALFNLALSLDCCDLRLSSANLSSLLCLVLTLGLAAVVWVIVGTTSSTIFLDSSTTGVGAVIDSFLSSIVGSTVFKSAASFSLASLCKSSSDFAGTF